MIAKKYKLPLALYVGKRGRILRAATCAVKLFPRETGDGRIGVVIGRTAGGAVSRNRIRRAIYDFFAAHRKELASYDAVVIVSSREKAPEPRAIIADLAALLQGLAKPQ